MVLTEMPGSYAVWRLEPSVPLPEPVNGAFYTSTRTDEEISIVCSEQLAPEGAEVEGGWAGFKFAGPIPFTQTGVLASVLGPLADAAIGIFVISTYDTDYLFIKAVDAAAALSALEANGHVVHRCTEQRAR